MWEEVLGDLTGDADIEMFWTPNLVDRADPAHEMNRYLGMGAYRSTAWHRLFDRAVPAFDEDGPERLGRD